MVRTKADGGASCSRKAVGSAAPRKALGGGAGCSSSSSPDSPSGNKYGGGNSYCPRPTPEWQKGISAFLSPQKSKDKENKQPGEDSGTGSSSSQDSAGTSQDSD